MLTLASSPMTDPSPSTDVCRARRGLALLLLFRRRRNEFAADRQMFVEPRLDGLARMGTMDAGDRAARDPLAGCERDAAPRHQFEQKAGGADRAVGKGAGFAGADLLAVDQGGHLPALESARTPILDFGADDQAIVVAEIGDDRDRTELVDRTQRRARNLDADMNGADQVGRFVEREA